MNNTWNMRRLTMEILDTSEKLLETARELHEFFDVIPDTEPTQEQIALSRRLHEFKLVHSMMAAFSEFMADTLREHKKV